MGWPKRAFVGLWGAALLLCALPAVGAEERPAGEAETRPEVPVTAIDLQRERAQNSPALAVDPTREEFVVAAHRVDGPEFGCGLHVSGDGGRSWLPARPVRELPEGAERCYAPEVAFNNRGRLYFLFVGLHGEGNEPMGAFLVTSDGGARTFSEPRQVLGEHRYMVRLAIDSEHGEHGRLHLVWVEATSPPPTGGFGPPPNPIMAAHSDDGGRTWSEPVQVSDPERNRVVAPSVEVDEDGTVHVAYYDLKDDARNYQGLEGPPWDGAWSLVVASSHDAGRTFSRHRVVDDGVVPGERVMLIFTMPAPALSTDGDGRLVAAWPDARHGDRDVLARRSLDGGASWEAPVRVNDDEPNNGRTQHLPQVDVAPNGRVDVVFYDRRDDPEDLRQHLYYAYSTDHGASFSDNERVTAEISDSRTGPSYPLPSARGQTEFGSRLGLVSQEETVLTAWTDTRLPFQGLLHQDVFATAIRPPPAGNAWPGSWPLVVLVAITGIGAVLAIGRWARGHARLTAPAAGAVVVAALTTGCVLPWTSSEELPPSATTVQVGLDEYDFAVPASVPAGRVVFEIENHGDEHHELVLVALPPDGPPVETLFGDEADRHALPTRMHLRPREPGAGGVFAMDLAPGRYGLMCFLKDDDGHQHVHRGMVAEFEVVEPDSVDDG